MTIQKLLQNKNVFKLVVSLVNYGKPMNQQNSFTVVNELHHMKRIRRGPLSAYAQRKMIQNILPGRGRKQIPFSGIDNVDTLVLKVAVSRRMVV
ncbi:hypothetical protein TNIN_18341 [Trichonephila inaurata madagascariensis]|uniref:Uncharacterized protein n=1 Tax=Trichonephila inaurata madagascariensis TaxID=2747483 RepID=A0A8X7CH12_9ARAC|nr:hypothetical protein TNIN_18341 [Trichonephila inaurata madagascariensis]